MLLKIMQLCAVTAKSCVHFTKACCRNLPFYIIFNQLKPQLPNEQACTSYTDADTSFPA